MATVLITGANRGIGLALASLYLGRGDRVLATARDPAGATHLATLGAGPAARLRVYRMDVGEAASIAEAKALIGDQPIDVLINNAGVIGPARQSALDMDFDGFARTLAVNTLGPLRVTQAFLPNLEAAPRGKVATISSQMGSLSNAAADRLAYRASKTAVNKLMQGLATELEPRGVAALTLHPGWVRTDMGGGGADLDVREAAAGIVATVEALKLATTGRFLNYRGETMPW
jgi:NAD(P)-dependent dehydrogenase (short-subunit alcohol dehydrogenase family)